MSIIVLEGPDGSGKSTLGKQLEKLLKGQYRHSGRPTSKQEIENLISDLETLAYSKNVYIIDRAPWVSEFIYSKVMNNALLTTPERLIEGWGYPQQIVYCCPTGINEASVSLEHKKHKPEKYLGLVIGRHKRIVQAYEDFFDHQPQLNPIRYNWKNESIEELEKKLCAA